MDAAPLIRWRWLDDGRPTIDECQAKVRALVDRGFAGLVLDANILLLAEGRGAPAILTEACDKFGLELWLAPTLDTPPSVTRKMLVCHDWTNSKGRWRKRRFAEPIVHAVAFAEGNEPLNLDTALDVTEAIRAGKQPLGLRRNVAYRVLAYGEETEPGCDPLDPSTWTKHWQPLLEALFVSWSQATGLWLTLPSLGEPKPESERLPWLKSFPRTQLPGLFVEVGRLTAQVRQQYWREALALAQQNFLAPLRTWSEARGIRLVERWQPNFGPELMWTEPPCSCAVKADGTLSLRALSSLRPELERFAVLPMLSDLTARERAARMTQCLLAGATRLVLDHECDLDLLESDGADLRVHLQRVLELCAEDIPGARVALLAPESSGLAHWSARDPLAHVIEADFAYLAEKLDELKFDFAVLSEAQLAAAEIAEGCLRCDHRTFELLVLPSITTLPTTLWHKLVAFTQQGGRVVAFGLLPRESEHGADDLLARSVMRTASVELPALYETFAQAVGNDGVFLDSFPVFREVSGGGRFCTFQPRLSADQDDATLRLHQILRESLTADWESLAEPLVYTRQTIDAETSRFLILNKRGHAVRATLRLRGAGHVERYDWNSTAWQPLPVYSVLNDEVIAAPVELAAFELLALRIAPPHRPHVATANFKVISVTQSNDAFIVRGVANQSGEIIAELEQQLPSDESSLHADDELQLFGAGPQLRAQRWSGRTQVTAVPKVSTLDQWQLVKQRPSLFARIRRKPSGPGSQTWRTEFEVETLTGLQAELEFLPRSDWLELRLNGAGWIRAVLTPWVFDVTGQLREGVNQLEIRVPSHIPGLVAQLVWLPVVELWIPRG